MRRLLKRLGYWTLYVLYLLVFFAAVDYFFFYRPWVRELRQSWRNLGRGAGDPTYVELDRVKHVEPEVMKRLGKVRIPKKSAFTRFAKPKGQGVVRLCAFGDSYTEGDEVGEAQDYPTRLGEIFARHGAANVEVLNFGVGGFGFHQSYVMWEQVAPGFGCDFDLLGPRGFQPVRDTTFGFIYSWTPFYIHARYVLDDGDVRLVEVPGDTYGERFDGFFSFVPRWRYLRYNRTAPAFLKAFTPKNRELPNPFYYDRRGMDEEADATYRILLAKMAARGETVVVGHHRQEIVDLANGLGAERLAAALFDEPVAFPYSAPRAHAGPLGNDLLARQFFALVTGSDAPLAAIETSDVEWPDAERPRRTLASYSKIEIEIAGVHAGSFVVPPGVGVTPTKADALVTLTSPHESVVDGCFFPADLELQPGMEVVLRSESSGRATDHPLGPLSVVGGGLNIGRAEVEGIECWTYRELRKLTDAGEPTPLTHGKRRYRGFFFCGSNELPLAQLDGTITVRVGDKEVLVGERGDMGGRPGFWLAPRERTLRFLRATADGLPDVDEMGASGVVEIVAEHWEDGVVRVPFAAWKKTTLPAPREGRPSSDILAIADGLARVEPSGR